MGFSRVTLGRGSHDALDQSLTRTVFIGNMRKFITRKADSGDGIQGLTACSPLFANTGTGYWMSTDTGSQSDKGLRSPHIHGGAISIRQCAARLEEATDMFRSVVQVLGRFAHMIPTSRIMETKPTNVSHDCRRNGSGQRDRDMFGSYSIHQLHIQGRAVSIDVAVPVEIKAMIALFFWHAFIYQVYVRRIPNV